MYIDPTGHSWESFWKGLAVFAGAALIVGAVALITVATGGTALPVLAGAAIGAGVSGGISVGVQLVTTGTVDIGKALVDMAVGGVMGAFGGSAVSRIGMALAGGITGFGGSLAGDWVDGNNVDWAKAAGAAALGALVSFAIGPGAQHGQLGARKAALATQQQIYSRNAAGGYRHATNFEFALNSNAGRITRVTSALNQVAMRSIIFNAVNTFELSVYQYLIFN